MKWNLDFLDDHFADVSNTKNLSYLLKTFPLDQVSHTLAPRNVRRVIKKTIIKENIK